MPHIPDQDRSERPHATPSVAFLRALPILGVWLLTMISGGSAAWPAPSSEAALCDMAARRAARDTGVPLDLLQAVARTETGRSGQGGLEPWPWTVNMEGQGRWFQTEDAARSYVFRHFKNGARSFDVGCFQINYKWHSAGFRSIDEMFDPTKNALYAARFLLSLHSEFSNWSAAVGAYHSRTPEFAKTYRAKFERIRRELQERIPAPASGSGTRSRLNATVSGALIASGSATLGSLVPIPAAAGRRGQIRAAFD